MDFFIQNSFEFPILSNWFAFLDKAAWLDSVIFFILATSASLKSLKNKRFSWKRLLPELINHFSTEDSKQQLLKTKKVYQTKDWCWTKSINNFSCTCIETSKSEITNYKNLCLFEFSGRFRFIYFITQRYIFIQNVKNIFNCKLELKLKLDKPNVPKEQDK